jgi:hypothetical protein|tara:strand:+ start:2217 stop:2435 length:219 start_codon:yes stop_codon:yes gene_type:complete
MGGLLSAPAAAPMPAPLPAPVAPQKSDADIMASRENERKRRLAAAGRQSTVLTSGEGVKEEAAVVKPTLLGT